MHHVRGVPLASPSIPVLAIATLCLALAAPPLLHASPRVASVTPSIGLTSGGQTVVITGTDLGGIVSVTFGGAGAAVLSTAPNLIRVVAPPHPHGIVDIVGTTATATVTSRLAFTYVSTPECFDWAPVIESPSGGGKFVNTGDFDGNGIMDVAMGGSWWASILLGRGNGSFGSASMYTVGGAGEDIAIADLNGDGKVDLAVALEPSDSISTLFGTGNGSFSAAVPYAVGDGPRSIAVGDFNADGLPDIAVANLNSNNVSVLLGTGAGAFSLAGHYPANASPYSVVVLDADADGRQDLAVANRTGTISLLRGSDGGTFLAPVTVSAGGIPQDYVHLIYPHALVVGDLNADGRQDLVLANSAAGKIAVLFGTGGGFTAPVSYAIAAGQRPRTLTVSDFNGDGRQDVAVGWSWGGSGFSVLLGTGNGNLADAVSYATGNSGGESVVSADFNGDGFIDLATANVYGPSVCLRLNGCVAQITRINPAVGPVTGGQSVEIKGLHLEQTTSVTFGGAGATISANSTTSVSVVTPPHPAGVVDVVVTTPHGTVARTNSYTYEHAPVANDATFTVTEAAPKGTLVGTVSASDVDAGTTLSFSITAGNDDGAFAIDSTTGAMTVLDPLNIDYERAATRSLSVTVSDGYLTDSAAITIQVIDINEPPLIVSMTPVTGVPAGGQTVVITGENLSGAISVVFGGAVATLSYVTATSVKVIAPTHSAGAVDVVVTTPFGSTTVRQGYFYAAPRSCFAFDPAVKYTLGSGLNALAAGDFNRDSNLDLVVGDSNTSKARTLPGSGTGTFGSPLDLAVGTVPNSIAVDDFNGDGFQDLAIANAYSGNVGVYFGTGVGTFTPSATYSFQSPWALAKGDINGDGRLDLVVAELTTARVWVLYGKGAGTFGTPVSYAINGQSTNSVAVGDFNGDGRLDVAATNEDSNTVSILLGTETGLGNPVNYAVGDAPMRVAVGDFDGDGRQDLAIAHCSYWNDVQILRGDGNGGFSRVAVYNLGSYAFDLAVGDLDGDGQQDLIVTRWMSSNNSVFVLRGTGSCTFAPPITLPSGAAGKSVVVGDFNGDARQDIAVATRSDGLYVYLNWCVPVVTGIAPTAGPPSGGQEVTLNGTNLGGATSVTFGGAEATIRSNTPTAIVVSTPTHTAGSVSVVVTTPAGASTKANFYAYDSPPVVDDQTFSIPENPPSGTAVGRVTATDADPGTALTFSIIGGNTDAAFTIEETTGLITVRNGRMVDYERTARYTLTVRASDGIFSDSAAVTINVLDVREPSVITSVTPAIGRATGGQTVVITGTFLTNVRSVTFGGTSGALGANTPSSITVTTPPHSAGLADVVVTTDYGSATALDGYRYVVPSSCAAFSAPSAYATGGGPTFIAAADFNGDGRQDLAAANYSSNDLSILLATSSRTLIDGGRVPAGASPGSVAVGDFNRDGRKDLAVTNLDSSKITILLATANGSFALGGTYYAGPYPVGVAVGDFDGDTNQDIVIANLWDDVFVMMGRSTGTFDEPAPLGLGFGAAAVAVGDFNADGRQDLAISDSVECVDILAGNGNGTFYDAGWYCIGSGTAAIAVGDFNADGHQDLAVAAQYPNSVSILTGNGTGQFSSITTYDVDGAPISMSVDDLNGDGWHDLAVATESATDVSVLFGSGGGNFAAPVHYAAGRVVNSVAAADVDGDGRQDLVVGGGWATPGVSLLLNGCAPTITRIEPAGGSPAGGQSVVITGTDLDGAIAVTFGGSAAPMTDATLTSIAATAPPHTVGSVDVVVTTPRGAVTATGAYRYDTPPEVRIETFELPIGPVAARTILRSRVAFSDPDPGDVHTARWDWGDGSTSSGVVTEPSAGGLGQISAEHLYTAAGVYTISVDVSDGLLSDVEPYRYVVVYDSTAGFVTGGGWIDSPPGGYAADASAQGKATFAFVARYDKTGAAAQTEFELHSASLRFKGASCEWLVISGGKAQYKSTGTLNDRAGYVLLLTATDGDAQPGGGPDRIRLKIWDAASGVIVYDNVRGASDDLSSAQQILSGGSIVVHSN